MSAQTHPPATAPSAVATQVDRRPVRRTSVTLRLAALTGVASATAAFVGLTIAETDTVGANPNSTADFLIDTFTRHTDELHIGAALTAAAYVLGMVFLGPLWRWFKPAGEWQAVVAVAGAATLSLFWLGCAAQMTAYLTFVEHGSGEAVRTLMITTWDSTWLLVVAFLVMALAASMAALAPWFRTVSLLVAALEAVTLVPGVDAYMPMMLGFAWVITLSLLVALGPDPDRRAIRA